MQTRPEGNILSTAELILGNTPTSSEINENKGLTDLLARDIAKLRGLEPSPVRDQVLATQREKLAIAMFEEVDTSGIELPIIADQSASETFSMVTRAAADRLVEVAGVRSRVGEHVESKRDRMSRSMVELAVKGPTTLLRRMYVRRNSGVHALASTVENRTV